MSDDRPITPEQALLAVKAAGLDPDKPLSAQLETSNEQGEYEALIARVADLEAKVEAAGQAPPTDPQHAFARALADKLNEAQSPSFTYGAPDAA
jgi:hypothetical protein